VISTGAESKRAGTEPARFVTHAVSSGPVQEPGVAHPLHLPCVNSL
jgi:hypothetical protein